MIERDGVYIGQVCVAPKYLDAVIERMYRDEKIDYAILLGSDTARYRDLVDAYVAAKKALRGRHKGSSVTLSDFHMQVRVIHGRVTETLTSRMKDKIDTPQGRAI